MKRFASILPALLLLFSFTSFAQSNTQCNAAFDFTITSGLTINFTPAVVGTTPSTQHKWYFGDGTSSETAIPAHTYASGGSYIVRHVVKLVSSGQVMCVDSVSKIIQLGNNSCALVANFSSFADSNNPLKIHFQNLTPSLSAGDSIRWTFGDGSSSHDINAMHTYSQPGNYTVCLRVKKNVTAGTTPCVSEVCRIVTINANNQCSLVASFTAHADSTNRLKYYFNNTSTPLASGDSIRWTFGDGTSSADYNATHIYSQPGTYNVCLRVKRRFSAAADCVREICKTIIVADSTPCLLQANFTFRKDSLQPAKIYFTNTSVPVSISNPFVKWSFGDGTYAYTWNTDHVYAQPGTYNVCLRISSSNICVREICKTVVVTTQCDRAANFNAVADAVNSRKINFTNLSQASNSTATAKWTFGDGTTANTWNALHEYAQPGRYLVCLRIEFYPGCVKEKCDTINVATTTNCQEISKWKSTRTLGDCLKFQFEPLQKNLGWQYHWTFGDGKGSHEMSPLYKYARSGTYTVCLTTFKSLECASTTCYTVQTGDCLNCDSVRLKFEYTRAPGMPNKLSFSAISNQPISSQQWTITKLPASVGSPPVVLIQNNPIYTFQDTGYYLVCLRAVSGGCTKEYCDVVRINEIPVNCTLQAYPNPAQNVVNVNVSLNQPEMIHAYVYNSLNMLVKEKHQQGYTGNNVVNINTEHLVPGMYTIRLIHGNRICYAQFQKL